MVRAILDGRKTQTRRMVKLHDFHSDYGEPQIDKAWIDDSYMKPEFGNVPCLKIPYGNESCVMGETVQRYFPKWEPGDRLWVKETFAPMFGGGYVFASDYTPERLKAKDGHGFWKSPRFMPRKASRITLEITAVRVERLQDISDTDAKAEGVTIQPDAEMTSHFIRGKQSPAQLEYFALWESINGEGSWEQNPWVWVIEFQKV